VLPFEHVDATSTRRLVRRTVMKTLTGSHNAVYRASGGQVGGHLKGMPVLLLTTTGRKSGKSRTTPLLYIEDGASFVVVASNGGSDYVPAWWLNLERDPNAQLELGRKHRAVIARKASPDERERLWREFTSRFDGYAKYATRTSREIPVVILEALPPG
jgi:deazaflavin-dependent oxidoreductase (nitroreductase family)